ncbi:MAG: DegV family EDD domain-containing protein [Clostridia bacterium]|nr:DegV family EDD domain-containing protein [Clostridia bacterium]
MRDFVILPDCTCDLSEQIRQDVGMNDYVRGHVHFSDGRDYLTDLEWDNFTREEYYRALSNKKCKITTAPPSPAEYYEAFEKYVKEGIGVISVSISSKISSTYNFACNAAQEIKKNYPEAQIYCFDSFRMSGGIGLLTLYAHILKNEGKSFDEVIAWLEQNKIRVHQMGPIDDLIFVARRGRITMGKAIMGNFAGVKPMGDCNADGYTTVLTKVKGIGKALDVTAEYVKRTAENIEEQYLLIAHSNRELYANTLKEKLIELNPKKVYVTDVYAGCGANIGPGMIGVYYLGAPVTDDLTAEKEIMSNIIKE